MKWISSIKMMVTSEIMSEVPFSDRCEKRRNVSCKKGLARCRVLNLAVQEYIIIPIGVCIDHTKP